MRFAVVGHVEWCTFVRVERIPRPGEIVHALETWEEPAGGGAVVAVQLARLAGEAALYTALGGDELGEKARRGLERLGVRVHTAPPEHPQRRAVVFVDEAGERTITVIGSKLRPRGASPALPWALLAQADGVFFVCGDAEALQAARQARVLAATPRELPTLREAGVELDALVGSGEDEGERYRPGDLDPPPKLVVATAGHLGGWAQPGGPFRAAGRPPVVEDAYGCGDSFAAGLTYGLADGLELADALALAAECGAEALARRGAHGRPERRTR
jgi:ribokinase